MKKYQITISIPEKITWIENAEDLKQVLEEDSNLWSVTYCESEIQVKELE